MINKMIQDITEDFYQHMLKSVPSLDSFERASLKLKFSQALEEQKHKLLQSIVEEIEVEKKEVVEPTEEDGVYRGLQVMRKKQDEAINNTLDSLKAKLTINIKE
jgi:hemoglobin-like flavoprotein